MKRLIDLTTLRPNPNAGNRTSFIVGKTHEVQGEGGVVGQTREYQRVYFMQPEGNWLCEYEPMDVTCRFCGSTFPCEDLAADSYPDLDSDDEIWSNAVCPFCRTFDCIEDIEYETPEEALRRRDGD